SIGSSSADSSNLVIGNGFAAGLNYIGTGDSTNRRFTIGGPQAYLRSNGTGPIAFTDPQAVTHSGAGTRQVRLGGANTDANVLAAQLVDNGASTFTLVKEDPGTWVLTNPTSAYTGSTTITSGVLGVDKLADGGLASSSGA